MGPEPLDARTGERVQQRGMEVLRQRRLVSLARLLRRGGDELLSPAGLEDRLEGEIRAHRGHALA
jgi:hypothetical protein